MFPKPYCHVAGRYALTLLVISILLIVFSSCGSTPTKRRGVKLSDASAEAAKEPEEQKPMRKKKQKKNEEENNDEEESYDEETIYVEAQPLTDETETTTEYVIDDSDASQPLEYFPGEPVAFYPHFGITVGGGSLRGDQIDGFGSFGLTLGLDFVDRRWYRLDMSGFYITTNRAADNQLSSGLVREYELAADLTGRYYFTPRHTFMGLYALGGVRFGYLFWDYKTAIVVSEPGKTETIDSDRLNYVSVFVGLGANLAQVKRIHIGANMSVGYKMYYGVTNEGFDNDIFGDEPMIQLMFDFTFFDSSKSM